MDPCEVAKELKREGWYAWASNYDGIVLRIFESSACGQKREPEERKICTQAAGNSSRTVLLFSELPVASLPVFGLRIGGPSIAYQAPPVPNDSRGPKAAG